MVSHFASLLLAAVLPLAGGTLLFHSYSSYGAMDSRLYVCDPVSGTAKELGDASFIHAMNGDFGSHCYDITFMAIDPAADEWDIFLCNTISGKIENLTKNSGFRNEDPKFSPDGKSIVFKRGHWSQETDGFVYELALLDLQTREIVMLTEGGGEESMPCFSPDGSKIYYANSDSSGTQICAFDLLTRESRCLYTEEGIHAYYPMASENGLFFTRWHSADLHNDCIVQLESGTPLPFCDPAYNCSDPFPLPSGGMLFSSTKSGSYDLHFYDGNAETPLDLYNTELNELGASCYTEVEMQRIVACTADHLLQRNSSPMQMDADGSGTVDAFDLALLKRMASKADAFSCDNS